MDKKNFQDHPEGSTPAKPPKRIHIPYLADPDFSKPLFKIPPEARERMFARLTLLYGEAEAKQWMPELERIIKVHHAHKPQELIDTEKNYDPTERFTEQDMVLITYGDAVKGARGSTLAALHRFIQTYNRGAINTIHILPFFPYSSDRGFAIIDFEMVDPKMGTWESIKNIGADYDLMFDGVLNHCSSRSEMFRGFLRGNPLYKDFFIVYDSPDDLTPDQRSKIFRPRTSDILTRFDTINGSRYVWTTFSEDQIDLNFRNPAVLIQVLAGLLFYVRREADIIRLDAVTYIWAEPGTDCVHLPETHAIVKLLRDVMDVAAPGVALITETNVPHQDNVSYFGNGYDEAQMVYNFALPPLVLHTFYTQDATAISKWAQNLKVDSNTATFFNMLDTHDGVGVMGVKGILSKTEIDFIIDSAKERGAYISYKMTEHKTEEPYEINTTWWSAINRDDSDEDIGLQVRRYIASRSIALVLKGVPGVYTHGVVALPNDHELVKKTGVKRDVNRGMIDPDLLAEELKDPESKRSQLGRIGSRINLPRTGNRAFHPQGEQRVLNVAPDVFTVLRISPEGNRHVLTMTNVTDRATGIEIPLAGLGVKETRWRDLVSQKEWMAVEDTLSIAFASYDVIWLVPAGEWETA
ncbi:MAG: sugar phosphorylase [Deltaproteobacteria bacterium]|nr:sugar phosphorylase [Deltaproteobacteria bacterium]